MNTTSKPEPRRISGCLLIILICLAAWALSTAVALRDPLKLMLEWELLAVFARPETHGWYRTVIAMVGCDVVIGAFIVAGAGWLALLVRRKSARFPVQVQAWLLAIVVMRTIAYLLGDHMTHTIGIAIAIPFDGFAQAVAAAALGIPYFRLSRRVQETFVAA
ncbi:DUF2569 domain-containing protein [Paraburkholderia haematera]|jgi:Protein of unknown function (DUF2569).|uniref:DUF2569 domain-containing protein n=1 Tax=Paraburkholderia haematera TaxID=2793077 RepID=A0ABM8QR91_9BURK|nr:DUF2569 domain-containing protein [Paraburkholderia haematera]CAE6710934.1 hypothetical protein R69888_01134 [Paraburkholderia haematera]